MNIENRAFQDERVVLDGNSYTNCTFRGCVMVYSATSELSLIDCRLDDVEWAFDGPAARVLSFLHATYQGGKDGEEFVRAIFRNFKRPLR